MRGKKRLVENLAKYSALIEMPFLKPQEAIIECGGREIDVRKHGLRINCRYTSGKIRAAGVTTEDLMNQHSDVFLEGIPEGQPPLRKINHEIRLKPAIELGAQPSTPSQNDGQKI